MRIEAARAEDARYVAERMRAKDVAEFLPLSRCETASELADLMVEQFGDHPAGYTFHLDEPIAVGAMVEGRPNVVTLLFYATDRFPEIALPLAKFTRRVLFPRYREGGVHRIECVSIDGYEEAHKWIRLLGLDHEAEMPGFGRGGETYHQFAWWERRQ